MTFTAQITPSRSCASYPLKVSIVVGDLSQSGAGRWGGAVRPFLLAQALTLIGCRVTLVGFTDNGTTLASTPDLPIVALPKPPYPQFLQAAYRLRQHLDGDILYAYKPKPSSFGVALLHTLYRRRPVILDIDDWELSWHGGDRLHYQPTLKQVARDLLKPDGALRQPDHPVYLKQMEKLVARADAVTVHTQFMQQRFGGVYIPNGKDVSLFDPDRHDPHAAKAQYGLTAYRTLMFPGAPRPYKGVEDVLQAIDRLNQPDLRLVIVGGSPYDEYDQHLMQHWGQWIIKLPKIPHREMPHVIAAADVIVVPQRDTPAALAQFPLKLTDGMAMAKPILSTRVGDIPSILGDTGYLVDPSAPEQLADAIQQIFSHPEAAARQGQRARARCVDRFSIQAMASELAIVVAQVTQRWDIKILGSGGCAPTP